MSHGPPVFAEVVCPACRGAACGVCGHTGQVVAELIERPQRWHDALAASDTDPAPPMVDEETPTP